ncbi:MAG: transcription termination/antitermination protein NusG [Firmicutes bacterium]|nr:transcription termination/antitermination protein NusG [Bacillota bacterium]
MDEKELEQEEEVIQELIEAEEETLVLSDDSGLSIMDVEEIEPAVEEAKEEPTSVRKVIHGEALVDGPPPPDLSQVGNRMDDEERWYILHTFSGYEAVAEDNLKKVVEKYNLHDRLKEIFIPTEDVVVEKRGKKTVVQQRTMPSYIFVKMIYGDDLWHTITRTRGITGFVGPKGRPLPLSPREVVDMKLERKTVIADTSDISVGDTVQVIDGPLAGQTASVTHVNQEAKTLTVSVSMFGRPTNVDLTFGQVKQI